MKTRITALFKIKYPIIMTGMSWISIPKLVAAVSEAGGLGILATGPLKPQETRESIRMIRKLTKKPFGAGATLLMPGAIENAEVILQEEVPVINFSLGKGDWIVEMAHEYGGKVIATVTNERHAKAAEAYGTDALLVTGNEAAAHGSQVSTLVLVPTIVDAIKIPVIATGGFCDGRGLVAALSLGAEGIAMGTRFSLTKESPVHIETNKAVLDKKVEETIYSIRFDGLNCRIMDTPAARRSVKKGRQILKGFFASFKIAKSLGKSWLSLLKGFTTPQIKPRNTRITKKEGAFDKVKKNKSIFKKMSFFINGIKDAIKISHMAKAYIEINAATERGDLEKGVHLIGQVQGRITEIPKAEDVIKNIISEAKKTSKLLAGKIK